MILLSLELCLRLCFYALEKMNNKNNDYLEYINEEVEDLREKRKKNNLKRQNKHRKKTNIKEFEYLIRLNLNF